MDYLPIFMDIRHAPCLVVGGGEIALRKIRLLLKAGANVTIMAPALHPELAQGRDQGQLRHLAQPFQPDHLSGYRLIIAATDDDAVNAHVSQAAQAANIPVNVVDNPARCSFIMPAIIDRSPLIAAISTGGGVPVLAREMRSRIEQALPMALGRLAPFASDRRDQVKARFPDVDQRRDFWESVINGPIAEQIFQGDEEGAAQQFERAIREERPQRGAIFLVGTGPGDPELLTLKALRLMSSADVVLHDQLVPEAILDLTRRDAERIAVGKKGPCHSVPQAEIEALLVRLAHENKRVLRLKGGDPMLFAHVGEELAAAQQAGVPCEIIPGITAASGAAAIAGIPLTHPAHADSVWMTTGHRRADGELGIDWAAACRPRQTVVVYMGGRQRARIAQGLITHGMAAETPAAIVIAATRPEQRTILTRLDALSAGDVALDSDAPSLLIIGAVVALARPTALQE